MYNLSLRYFFNKEGDFNSLTAAAYHKKIHLLVTGFASGIFHLHELPEFNLIHSLRLAWIVLSENKCNVNSIKRNTKFSLNSNSCFEKFRLSRNSSIFLKYARARS